MLNLNFCKLTAVINQNKKSYTIMKLCALQFYIKILQFSVALLFHEVPLKLNLSLILVAFTWES